jgi:Domain of unknown function (DUF4383)
MTTKLANTFGIALLILGLAGFTPGLTSNGMLFGIFQVNQGQNAFHLFAGTAAIWCTLSSTLAVRAYLRFFGALFAVLAVAGFFSDDGTVFGYMANNLPDAWLHFSFALVFVATSLLRTREPVLSHVI